MTKSIATFKFHNVGQGLFYSGEIDLSVSTFRFIYDCGSKSRKLIQSTIKQFKRDVTDNKINLLILSHLHEDHINGLEELFLQFKISEVILPYFTPVERLLIASKRLYYPEWYYNFLSDPVKYLVEHDVKRIIFLGGNKGSEVGAPPSEIEPFSKEDISQFKIEFDKLPNDEILIEQIIKNDKNWKKYIDSRRILIKKHDYNVFSMGKWMFRFYNYKVPSKAINTFNNCLIKFGLTSIDCKHLIINQNDRKNLKECYKRISRSLNYDFNNTSLVVYHSPIGKIDVDFIISCTPSCCFSQNINYYYCRYYNDFNRNLFGQLLTGDLNLNLKYAKLILSSL